MDPSRRGAGPDLPAADHPGEGRRVRVTKRLRFHDEVHPVVVEGRILERRRVRTESSVVGGPEGRHWVTEIVIEKAGGARSVIVVDPWTRVAPLDDDGRRGGGAERIEAKDGRSAERED